MQKKHFLYFRNQGTEKRSQKKMFCFLNINWGDFVYETVLRIFCQSRQKAPPAGDFHKLQNSAVHIKYNLKIAPIFKQDNLCGSSLRGSGQLDQFFAKYSRFQPQNYEKLIAGLLRQILTNSLQFLQTFSLTASNYMLVALALDR